VILVDSSVWIEHLRSHSAQLAVLLEEGLVYTHPAVIGELACGHLKNRIEFLALLRSLPSFPVATDDEVMAYVNNHKLYGKGIGWVDAHLLASVALSDQGELLTFDKRLAELC
jgi:predicted nucleic acid-binding protein